MTFLTEHWRLMVFRRTEGKRSSSCTWAHSQIVAWCVMERFRCQGKSSQLRGTWVTTWENRHPLLTSSQGGGKPRYSVGQLWYESRVSWRLHWSCGQHSSIWKDRDVTRRLVDVLATLSLVNAAEQGEVTATVFKMYLVPGLESMAPRLRWRNQEQARSRARRRPRATGSPVRACVGGVPAQSGGDQGAGTRTRCGVEVVLGEQRAEERTSAAGGARTAKPCKKIIVFCLDSVTLPLERALDAALQLQKGVRKHGPAPRAPRARSIEAPNTDAREVERLAHRVEQYSLRMADLLRRGVLEPSMVYAFLMTKGGQQVPQPKSKAKAPARSREMMSEGAEQTPDVSPPRLPPERPPTVFVRGETLEPSTARPKVRISRKSRPQSVGDPAQERRFALLHGIGCTFFFLRREILHGPLCKDDTYMLFFFKAPQHKDDA